ncbi:MFS transporter [Paraburkholderia phytofirmans]|uniref:Major facilitator superfamily MFS_1 n=2 Tax=Paraburkholderia phytofirmans TaxID=261302 RepID=B2T9D8_PARPJ|nr:MFS transporter [Paraburkholderia phytofirmans]ACD21040.1 major facilitator superfamily MFS_1 [Paraburkholderia phytofirmans PsJN]
MNTPSQVSVPSGQPMHGLDYSARHERYWRRNLAVCVFGSFTTLVSLSMLLPFLPIYVQQLGVQSQSAVIQWSGIAFGATFLGTAVTAPVWGRLADRYGRKPMLVRAAVGMAVVMSLIGVAHNVHQLVALRLLAGLVGGYSSASTVMVGTQAPKERAGWALGVLSTGALAGNLIGPLVGGFLPGWLGIRGTFFAGGAMIAVAALLTIFVVKEDFDPATHSSRRPPEHATASTHRNNYPVIAALLVTAMMVLLANMSIEPVITVYVGSLGVQSLHLARVAGIVMACSAFGSMLTAARLGALADRVGSWNVIVACLVLTGLVMIPQAFVHAWWQLAGLRALMGMTLAGLLPAIAKLARHAVEEHKTGQMLGYLQSAQFSGQVVGPIIGGVIAVHLGLHSVFFVTGSLLVACAALAQWARTRQSLAV